MVTEGESRLLQAEEVEDSDMKIAGSKPEEPADDGELAAREFNEQKANGNIERAYKLGDRLAALLFTTDEILALSAAPKYAQNEAVRTNARVLFAFMVDILLENCCPGSVTARTALNEFHKCVSERSEEIYRSIVDSPAFSLYLLCARDEKMASCSCIGHAFADGCGMDGDAGVATVGDELYGAFYERCAAEIRKTDFIY